MLFPSPADPHTGSRTVDLVFGVVVVALIGLTVTGVAQGNLAIAAPGWDLVLDAVTTVVVLAVALLAFARYRVRGDATSLFQCAALVVLTVANMSTIVPGLTGSDPVAIRGTPSNQVPFFVVTFAQLLAAALLFGGGVASLRRIVPANRSVILLGPIFAVLGLVLVAQVIGSSQPWLAARTPLGVLLQLASAALFVSAAYLSRRAFRREGSIGDGYMVIALTVAAFAEINATFDLSISPGLVTTPDLLQLVFGGVLLVEFTADLRATITALWDANQRLEGLREADLDRAALEERARLARELHDGLAQNLWIAKLKAGRLSTLHGLGPEAIALSGELITAIDAGLAEARQAVMTLRLRARGSFAELMSEYVDDFSDAFSLRAEFTCGPDLPRLAPRAEAELIRIAQEALNNARRHANATVVRVEAMVVDDNLRLTVADNGRGFETASVKKGAFGLTSMDERAALIGGKVTIVSRPHDGTSVSVEVPLAAATSQMLAPA